MQLIHCAVQQRLTPPWSNHAPIKTKEKTSFPAEWTVSRSLTIISALLQWAAGRGGGGKGSHPRPLQAVGSEPRSRETSAASSPEDAGLLLCFLPVPLPRHQGQAGPPSCPPDHALSPRLSRGAPPRPARRGAPPIQVFPGARSSWTCLHFLILPNSCRVPHQIRGLGFLTLASALGKLT